MSDRTAQYRKQIRRNHLFHKMFEGLETRRLFAASYTVKDLTPPGETSAAAYGVSNNGHVAITTNGGDYVYYNGAFTKLGITGLAIDVNDAGQVAGTDSKDLNHVSAYFWQNGTETKIPLPAGSTSSGATAINSKGDVVGYFFNAQGRERGFLYTRSTGKTIDLGVLPGGAFSAAQGLNDSGQVIGNADNSSGNQHGFLYSNGAMKDLGVLPGGTAGSAYHGITNAGLIAGDSATSGSSAYHVYTSQAGGALKDLGTAPTAVDIYAYDINSAGTIVGYDVVPDHTNGNAFILSGGTYKQLQPLYDAASGITMTAARGINDAGLIVGYGTKSGHQVGILLTPIAAVSTGTIAGIAYKDTNANGKQDAGEAGLAGVQVFAAIGGGGSAITGADGRYSVTLQPGSYSVFSPTPDGYSVTTNPVQTLTVTAGKATAFDLGETPSNAGPGKSTIKGTVFNDANNNGVQDSGEAGIKGVTVSATQTAQPALVAAAAPAPTLVTTDASGNYVFTNLAAGDYTVADTVPAADTQTAPASGKHDLTIGLSGSQTIFGQNFGLKAKPVAATHSVSGTVYNDTNNDSKLTSGEAGFGGITVTLTPTGNTPGKVQTFVTTSNGLYSFSGLADGSYTVSAPVPAGYTKTSPSEGNAFFLNFVQGNGDTVGANFGFYKAPVANDSISGTVFTDANNNHVLDAGETGIAGVTVTLTPQNGAAPTTFVTTSSGVYSFTGLPVGQYGVKSTVPSGFTQTAPNVKPTFLIDLTTSGQNISQANFGFYKAPTQTISITGQAFEDTNGNGLRDQGEIGVLPGVTIKLTGLATTTTTTGNGGGFTFSNLAPGIYTLTQVALSGYTTTTQPLTLDAPHYDALPLFGQKKADVATGIVTGHVYVDANGNGKADPGEAPVGNATIVLIPGNGIPASRPASPPAGSIVVTSNAGGDYEAVGLKPGPYAEYQQLPAGFTQTQPATTFYGVSVVSGNSITQDFGRQAIPPANNASVAGTVFNDANNNGKQDPGENGLPDVEVDLTTTIGNGFYSLITGGDGKFDFTQLPAGSYNLTEKVLTGYTQTKPASGGYKVTLTAGQAVTGELFGQYQTPVAPTTGSVSGTAFNDVLGDGIRQSGEGALVGVTIHLVPLQANRIAGAPALVAGFTAITGADGSYSFTNVAPGTYNLYEDVFTGYTQTVPNQDGYAVDVVAGGSVGGKTFAQHQTVVPPPPPGKGTITGTLWNDTDGDGQFNHGETGTGSRTVFLDTNGNGKLDAGERSTQSNGAGVYTFADVAAGTVKVSRLFPAGYHLSNAAPGTNGHDVLATVTGGATTTADLGTHEDGGTPPPPPPSRGTISGTLWNDTDGDGQFDNGEETGTGMRTVFLDTNRNGKLDAGERSVQSDMHGKYSFGNVPIGKVAVSRLFPSGFHLSNPSAGTGGHDVLTDVLGGKTVIVNLGTHENGANQK